MEKNQANAKELPKEVSSQKLRERDRNESSGTGRPNSSAPEEKKEIIFLMTRLNSRPIRGAETCATVRISWRARAARGLALCFTL